MQIDIYPISNALHLHQIFCGFDKVGRYEGVRIRYFSTGAHRYGVDGTSTDKVEAIAVVAELSNGLRLCFETHDSAEISQALYDQCDFYFKRSFHKKEHASLPKVHALGFNLDVRTSGFHWAQLWRAVFLSRGRRRFRDIARAINFPGFFVPDERWLSGIPEPSDQPRILFMTRAWDPSEAITPQGYELRKEVNEGRAECVRALRKEFGPAFRGGFEDTPFARERWGDLIVKRTASSKRAYLRSVKRADICVTTMGLHRSTGWKFAEYVALGRAIVCEPNVFEPGEDLTAGRNFLEFNSPKECVEAVASLVEDRAARAEMMLRNASYYREKGHPEAIVARALSKALCESNRGSSDFLGDGRDRER